VLTIILIIINVVIRNENLMDGHCTMYVCLCKGITDTQIRAAVEHGASSLREVNSALGVASQCGKCGIMARDIVRESLDDLTERQQQLFYAVT
jgi:bacterioferritin-associated ferredoxin